jgi:long-subunit fatty acid transport protein
MKGLVTGCAMVALSAGAATAGGVERSTQSVGILFEQGRYAELSFGYFEPDVSGVTQVPVGPFPAGAPSGDMAPGYGTFALGYKQALSDTLDLAVILDQPIGADVSYPGIFGLSPYPLAGTTADLQSLAVTGLLRYKLPNNVSLIGGLRAEQVKGEISIPFVGSPGPGYTLETNRDLEFGYVLGVAWEKPEIAARVALTYNSAITHTLDSVEGGPLPQTGTFETEVPQSVNLEFQTGIAADTLLFGSVRWVEWSAFTIDPPGYPLATPLVSYQNNRITYSLGVGRRFNEQWSAAVTLGYEPSDGAITGNLGPTDGFSSIGLAATYTMDNMKITAGIRYVDIGGAVTSIGARFADNDGLGVGVRVGYSF